MAKRGANLNDWRCHESVDEFVTENERCRREEEREKWNKKLENWTDRGHLSIVFDARSARHFSAIHCSIECAFLSWRFDFRFIHLLVCLPTIGWTHYYYAVFRCCCCWYWIVTKHFIHLNPLIVILSNCNYMWSERRWVFIVHEWWQTGKLITGIEIVFFFRCCLLCFSFWLWILFCRFTLFFQVLIFHLLAFRYLKHRKIPAAEGKKPTICSIFKCQMISSCDLFCVENFIDVSFFRFFGSIQCLLDFLFFNSLESFSLIYFKIL